VEEMPVFYQPRFTCIGHFPSTGHPDIKQGNIGANDHLEAWGCNQVSNRLKSFSSKRPSAYLM
jgi:hypothetical protein